MAHTPSSISTPTIISCTVTGSPRARTPRLRQTRRRLKKGTCPRRSEVPQSDHEEHQTYAAAQESDNSRSNDARKLGGLPPIHSPRPMFTDPATRPFISTICGGSERDFTCEVDIKATSNACADDCKGPGNVRQHGVPDHERTAVPATRHAMPRTIRRSKCSWNKEPLVGTVAPPSG
jgi:hypothetical protein